MQAATATTLDALSPAPFLQTDSLGVLLCPPQCGLFLLERMKPAVRQLLIGEPQQWRNTQAALKAFITANYNQPNPHNQAAMAVPPTITVTAGGTPPTGVTSANLYTAGSAVQRYAGGSDFTYVSAFRRFPSATMADTGGNIGNGQQAIAWRATVVCNGAKVAFRVLGGAGIGYRFTVNGQYVSTTATSVPTGGGNYVLLDFGSAASRTVAIEGDLDCGYQGVYVTPGDTIAAAAQGKRMIVLGDSFCEATGATERADGLGLVAGDMLGIADVWQSGVGGTGYVATNTNTRFAQGHPARLADASNNGPWDIIVVAQGINDIGQSTVVITGQSGFVVAGLRKFNPNAQIFVVGPWDVNAPLAPVANYAATKSAIRSGIPSGAGATFLDPEGVQYTKSDATHPDTAGHDTLGKWLALAIKNALGA